MNQLFVKQLDFALYVEQLKEREKEIKEQEREIKRRTVIFVSLVLLTLFLQSKI